MSALSAYVGLSGPDYPVEIERGAVLRFARAMQADVPEFQDVDSAVIPALFPVSLPYTFGYTLERSRGTVLGSLPHNFSVPLHAEERITFHGLLPCIGERLVARGTLEDVQIKTGRRGGRLTFFTFLTEYRALDGVLRISQRTVSVTTETPPEPVDSEDTPPAYVPRYETLEPASPFLAIARVELPDIAIGDSPGTVRTGPLLLGEIVRFQSVVGEDDPSHYDAAWAQAQGYAAPLGLGTHHAGRLLAYAAHWLDPGAVRDLKIRFGAISWPGRRHAYNGAVIECDEREIRVHLVCDDDQKRRICEIRLTLAID